MNSKRSLNSPFLKKHEAFLLGTMSTEIQKNQGTLFIYTTMAVVQTSTPFSTPRLIALQTHHQVLQPHNSKPAIKELLLRHSLTDSATLLEVAFDT